MGLEVGGGEKAGPSGNSRPRLPEPRAPTGTQAPPPHGSGRRCYHGNAREEGLGARSGEAFKWAGGAGRGEGARAGSGQPEARSFLGIFRFRNFSISESPTTAIA